MADTSKIKVLFGEWLELTPAEREERNLPASQSAFADKHKIHRRTTIRWKTDPLVVAAHDAAKAKREADSAQDRGLKRPYTRPDEPLEGPEISSEPPAEGDLDLSDDPTMAGFDRIRQDLEAKALRGDPKALETYMKYWGRDAIEAQKAREESVFADLSDTELVDKVLTMIGREAVQRWLSVA